MSPRWFDGKDHLALDTGGGPLARLWSTALAGLVDIGYVKATGNSVQINLPKTALKGPVSLEWKMPQYGSNTIERNRARTYFQAYAAACALHFAEKALVEIRAGRTKTWEKFDGPDEGIGCGFTEAVRGVLSHHMVIRDGKIANYHPYPPTPWNANPRDSYGTPGPYEDAVQGQPIFEENDREHFKGIDIMRTVRSFDPCLPCGVHMYLGKGKTLGEVALPDPVRDRGMSVWPHRPEEPGDDAQWRTAGDRIQTLLDASAAGGAVARERAEQLVREVTDLYGAGLERMMRLAVAGRPGLVGRVRRRRPGRQPAAGARPAPARRRTRGSTTRWTASGPIWARTAATCTCSRSPTSVGPAAVRGQLQELSVVGGDAGAGGRGCGARGGAGDLIDRGGGRRSDTECQVIPAESLAEPRHTDGHRPVSLASGARPRRPRARRSRRASGSRAPRCWPAGSATSCSPTGTAAALR